VDTALVRQSDGFAGLEIPYEFYGVAHKFIPDFIVRLTNGISLILEVKGMHGEKEDAKFQAAKRWVSAVNNWGRMGQWQFHVCKDPNVLKKELAYLFAAGPVKAAAA
jgi:type III restriction enzyme